MVNSINKPSKRHDVDVIICVYLVLLPAIILPTAFQYLQFIGITQEYLLGAVISGEKFPNILRPLRRLIIAVYFYFRSF